LRRASCLDRCGALRVSTDVAHVNCDLVRSIFLSRSGQN